MITLGLDSCGRAAGAAILQDDRLLYESYLDNGLTHSETLLPMVEAAFAACGISAAQLDLIGVGAGPGSFTGLRIGMALAKGLALPRAVPCAAVSSLEGIARGIFLPEGALVLAAEDARRGEVYYAAFRRQGQTLLRLCPDSVGRPAALAELLAGEEKTIFVVGDGAQVCYNELEDKLPVELVPSLWRLGRAAGVALGARVIWSQGGAQDASALRPAYHRLSQAQREREKKLKEAKHQ